MLSIRLPGSGVASIRDTLRMYLRSQAFIGPDRYHVNQPEVNIALKNKVMLTGGLPEVVALQ